MDIKALYRISLDYIYEAFSAAFADYDMQLTADQLFAMLRRRGFDPALSFASFDKKGRITAFTLNGLGHHNGLLTAYDTGTGTLPGHRGKGLASSIFRHSLPYLKEAGVRQYLLEVLQHNTTAISVYRNLGFTPTREFNFFTQDISLVTNPVHNTRYNIVPLKTGQLPALAGFMDFQPSWQNSFESIQRSEKEFVILGASLHDEIIGYCVSEPSSGDITQIAVEPSHRRKGVASSLLAEAIKHIQYPRIKVINTETTCDSITGFLSAMNIPLSGKQYEMILKID